MTPPGRRSVAARGRRAASVITLLLVGVLTGVLTAAAPGVAATTTTPTTTAPAAVAVSGGLTLTAVTPGVVTRASALTVTGVLTSGTSTLTGPRVSLVRGGTRLGTRQDVTDWSASTDVASGVRLTSVSPADTLAPGKAVAFTLTVPAGTLRDSTPYGVLPVAVEVSSDRGTTSVHTFVGWYARKEYEPIGLAVVAPVTLPADTALYADDATVRSRAWKRDLGAGSRIDRLLQGTDVPGVPVTWAVDPAVVGPGTDPGDPGGSGASIPPTGTTGTNGPGASPSTPSTAPPSAAPRPTSATGATGSTNPDLGPDPVATSQQALAARLAAGATRHPVWALPYGDPDLAATLSSPSDPVVTRAIARAGDLAGRLGTTTVTTGVAWPVDGGLAPERETALRTAFGSGLRSTLVSSSTLPQTSGFSATGPHLSPSEIPVVGWDDAMSTLTTRTRTVADGVLATQELVAQTVTLLGQSPGVQRSFLIALPRTIDPSPDALRSMLTTLASVPWVRLGSADALVSAAASAGEVLTSMSRSSWPVTAPAMTATLRGRVDTTRAAVLTVATLLPRRSGEVARWQDALDQVPSSRWRGRPADAAALVDATAQWARTATSGIRVVGQDTNFLADEGILQVTVVNDLSEPVVGLVLRLSPSNPRLRVIEQPDAFPIGARSRATVRVRVRAVAAGLVPVTVSLQAGNGMAVGTSAQLNVRANPPGRAFYLGSGAVLVALVLFGVFRAVRRRRRPGSAP